MTIQLELNWKGGDNIPYTGEQYCALARLSNCIMQYYPNIGMGQIVGHNDIAPLRKTDPGQAFDWARFRQMLDVPLNNNNDIVLKKTSKEKLNNDTD